MNSNKLIIKTIARTLVYQTLLLWTGFSIGFMLNPEYWGNRAPLVQRSIKNIFYPIEYDQNVENFLLDVGRSRIFFGLPEGSSNLRIIDDSMINDETYIANYEYVLDDKKIIVENYTTKINWKPWEYDYPQPNQKISDSMEDFE